ncbi:hypothetical protein [Streptomyces liangshanensis]|uniref:hypothetical protein n=1 Tax=Streptomyces liangshanensis TaxID=2717324 RepID=UPI0036DCD84D
MFQSTQPKEMAREVAAAYSARIDAMATYGSDSPEGLVAEELADQKADAFREQVGGDWQSYTH